MTISAIVDIIILIGALVGAIMTIYKFCLGSGRKMKKINEDNLVKILDEKIPQMLADNSKRTAEKRKVEMEEQINTIVTPLFEETDKRLDEILEINKDQTEQIKNLEQSNSDMLRREIVKIYYKYRPYKKIPQFDKQDCAKFIEEYQGNSYVHDIWNEMRTWEVVESVTEIKEVE